MIGRIHHVGVVVRDLEASLGFWRDTLELPLLRSADLPEQGVRAALLACGAGEVELLAPLTTDSGVARFLASRGESVHHVCFESDDVVKEVRRFLGTGVDMIDGKPRPGLAGKVAFVHPRSCGKLLVELATPSSRTPLPETALALTAVHGKVEDVGDGGPAAPGPVRDEPRLRGGGRVVRAARSGRGLIQLSPLGGGYTKSAFTALRVRTADLPALARRLAERGRLGQESAVGLVVASAPGQGAPLIVQASG